MSMKFITAFVTMLMRGMMHNRRNFYEKPSERSRLRILGSRGVPGSKLQRNFSEKMATKRGRRSNYNF